MAGPPKEIIVAKVQAPSGFRDFLPDQARKRSFLVQKIREIYESFGFEPMETPTLENLGVLLGKGGGENEKLMFRVLKRGAELDRAIAQSSELSDLGLRYDLTVPLARYYATHRGELPSVFKRYHMAPVFRAERPQHGRFREFVQCDIDILGSSSAMAEIEVIVATANALSALGFRDLDIRINSRPLLTLLVQALGVPEAQTGTALVVIDKQDKVSREDLARELATKGVAEDVSERLLEFMAQCRECALGERMPLLEQKVGATGSKHIEGIREILDGTPQLPSGRLVFDPLLARGLDYYTGPIFEVLAQGVPFSLGGGGRFDNLVGALSGTGVPAVGFSIGFERVFTLMDERGMLGETPLSTDVFLAIADPVANGRAALGLAADLRAQGVRVDMYVGGGKVGAQFDLAQKKGLRRAIIVGSRQPADGSVTVRDLTTRQDHDVPRQELAAWLRNVASTP